MGIVAFLFERREYAFEVQLSLSPRMFGERLSTEGAVGGVFHIETVSKLTEVLAEAKMHGGVSAFRLFRLFLKLGHLVACALPLFFKSGNQLFGCSRLFFSTLNLFTGGFSSFESLSELCDSAFTERSLISLGCKPLLAESFQFGREFFNTPDRLVYILLCLGSLR